MGTFEGERFEVAAARFKAFFDELGRAFIERDDLIAQIALALLCREHVLMTGPPGTAKSEIASAVLGRVIDEATGMPSVYSRQFTESTVQTDLVGPINFKTLMETGRTEHFTDQGMLGAVHAFLDEVFDGRDMLLRSTLNVLQERELKEGTRTTRGRIECALMTTNRYLSEVLEGSRETLLAFVDRIAFVSFVPKGFADSNSLGVVLKRNIGGARRPTLEAVLTLQDLDHLQAAVDGVLIPDAACDALQRLIEALETETAATMRADPAFVPTRYLSTRTAVRLGKILRAICVYRKVFFTPDRPFEVVRKDFDMLRLALLLGGPAPKAAGSMLGRESDPRERRQIEIVRTERELFERVLNRVPTFATPAPAPPPTSARGKGSSRKVKAAKAEEPQGEVLDEARLREQAQRLIDRALRAGLTPATHDDASVDEAVTEIAKMADAIEKSSGERRPLARWLRGRALSLLDEVASRTAPVTGAGLTALIGEDSTDEAVAKQANARLERLEQFQATRAKLRALGADHEGREASEALWTRAVTRATDELALLLDAQFHVAAEATIARLASSELGRLLSELELPFARVDQYGARLAAIGGDAATLKARVVGNRLRPVVGAAFDRFDAGDRFRVVEQVDALLKEVRAAGLQHAIPSGDILAWSARALVRTEPALPPPAPSTSPAEPPPSLESYRAMRAGEQRVPLAYVLVEIVFRLAPSIAAEGPPAGAVAKVGEQVAALPEDIRADVARLDLARLDRAIAFLERWWLGLRGTAEAELTATHLAELATSGFFHVTRDEGALLRFALEARVLGEVLPSCTEAAAALRGRIEKLEAASSGHIATLLQSRADARWSAPLR